MTFVYLWSAAATNILLIVLMKWQMATAWLWLIPINILLYLVLWQVCRSETHARPTQLTPCKTLPRALKGAARRDPRATNTARSPSAISCLRCIRGAQPRLFPGRCSQTQQAPPPPAPLPGRRSQT